MILLDTNALIWLVQKHRRAQPLQDRTGLHISPASVLELQYLVEAGKLRAPGQYSSDAIVNDPRYALDEPAAGRWFEQAAEVSWTRDPFDRLLVAHARLRRWKLATGDGPLLERLRPSESLAL